jgi:5-methylcytosine-specific restriction endonuclease McrA
MSKRRFSSKQRVALFIRAQGRCGLCGVRLEPRWHADHERPYSRQGPTDALNGQALCPKCNREKGAKEKS